MVCFRHFWQRFFEETIGITFTQERNSCRLLRGGSIFYESGLYLNQFFSFLDIQPDVIAGALASQQPSHQQMPLGSVPEPIQQGIEFRNVSIHYLGSEHRVLQKLSFTIPPGTSVAVVGENGAGKTTLVKLLARFYSTVEICELENIIAQLGHLAAQFNLNALNSASNCLTRKITLMRPRNPVTSLLEE